MASIRGKRRRGRTRVRDSQPTRNLLIVVSPHRVQLRLPDAEWVRGRVYIHCDGRIGVGGNAVREGTRAVQQFELPLERSHPPVLIPTSSDPQQIENQFAHYIRDDGLTDYRANEVAQQCRMLTILALYHSYSDSDGDSDAFLLRHFARAKAIADWLIARRRTSLAEFAADDPRYGLIAGLDEGDSFSHVRFHQGPYPPQYWYSHIAEAYRAFIEIGQVWAEVGKAAGRADVVAHAAELLLLAPEMYENLHASLRKTANTTASPGHTCYPDNA